MSSGARFLPVTLLATALLVDGASAEELGPLFEWPSSLGGSGHWYEIVPLGGLNQYGIAEYMAQLRGGRVSELEMPGEGGYVASKLAEGAARGPAFVALERRPRREPNLLDATRDAFAWLRDASSDRLVDVVLIGDSNVSFSGFGWDHGLQHAMHSAGWPCAAIGPTPFNDDGGTVGWRWVKNIGAGQQWPSPLGNHATSTLNAPAPLAAEMDFPFGFPNTGAGYAWLSGGTAPIPGGLFLAPDHPFVTGNQPFDFRLEYGRMPKGGHFTPSAWLEQAGAVVSSAEVQCGSKSYSMAEAVLHVPAGFAGGQWLRLTIDGGQGVQAPFFLGWATLERTGLAHGWCVSVLDWHGGATTQRLAEDVESFRAQASHRWVSAIRSRQLRHGGGARVVFLISSGMNDFGITVDQHAEGLERMMAHLSARWVDGGGTADEIRFILMTSHDPWTNDPTAHLVAIRERCRQIAAARGDVAAIDLGAIPMSPAYYENGALGAPHLSPFGYETMSSAILSALDGSQGEACSWRWRSGVAADVAIDESMVSPCTRAIGAIDSRSPQLRGITESTRLGYALIEYSADCDGDGIVDRGAISQGLAVDFNCNGIPDSCECVGDLDQNGAVEAPDLSLLLMNWGSSGGIADLNRSGVVDAADLVMLLSRWGSCSGS